MIANVLESDKIGVAHFVAALEVHLHTPKRSAVIPDSLMEISEEQYQKIQNFLPKQRGHNIANLTLLNALVYRCEK